MKTEIYEKIDSQIRNSYRVFQLTQRFRNLEKEDIVQEIWQFILKYGENLTTQNINRLIKCCCLNIYKKLKESFEYNLEYLENLNPEKFLYQRKEIKLRIYFLKKKLLEQNKNTEVLKYLKIVFEDPFITTQDLSKKLKWSLGKVSMVRKKLQQKLNNDFANYF